MKTIPFEIQELYVHYSHSETLQTKELAVVLDTVLRNYHRIYLVIDVLNEFLKRHQILDLFASVINDLIFKKLQVFVIS